MASEYCKYCECDLPVGCRHMYGTDPKCPLGPRRDPEWIVGMAIWKDLTDRRGVKHELERCDPEIQQEIIETIGRKAIAAYESTGLSPEIET